MAVRDVLLLGNPKLRAGSTNVTDFDDEFNRIVRDLKDTLTFLQETRKTGRGLAAPQIGQLKKVIVFQLLERSFVMVNPEITWRSEVMFRVWDTCFSFDLAFLVEVERHKCLKVRYQDENGTVQEEEFTDDLSELMQHEIDHLHGILATDHVEDATKIIMRAEWERRRHRVGKRIGILGGISHESTIRYYEIILKEYHRRYGDYYYPEIVIFSLNFQKFTDNENGEDMGKHVEYIMEGVRALQDAGADFIVMAANSAHRVFDEVQRLATVPILSIVQITCQKAKQIGMKRLLLLGAKVTMESPIYPDACRELGIHLIVPAAKAQDAIDRIIFDELVLGEFKETSKRRLLNIIGGYDVDGAILGCTELPLILKPGDADVDLLDTMTLHAIAALDYALEE